MAVRARLKEAATRGIETRVERIAAGGRTTVQNVTAGKGGTALAIFGVLIVGWLFVTGRLKAVGTVISQGPGALDQLLRRNPMPKPEIAGTLPTAPIAGVFPGGSLPGTPPIAPGPGAVPRRRVLHLPNAKNGNLPPVDIELPQEQDLCLKAAKVAATSLGYSRVDAERIALNACGWTGSPAPVPAGGG